MRTHAFLGGAIALVACSGAAATPTVTESVDQETWTVRQDSHSKYLLLVVDDTASGDANVLRADVLEAFRARANYLAGNQTSRQREQWEPVRWHVIVVRPSGDGAHTIVGPATDARLAWIEDDASPVGAARVIEGIGAALADPNPDPLRPYRPIEAESDAIALLTQNRSPRSAVERAITDMIAMDPGEIQPFVASTREDETPASKIAPPRWFLSAANRPVDGPTLVAPTGTRLEVWARSGGESMVITWPFARPWGLESLDFYEHGMGCFPARSASCELLVRTPDLGPCPVDRGWTDPRARVGLRHPRIERSQTDGSQRRVCEVMPFAGDLLERCQTGARCEGSGWCLTDAPRSSCPAPTLRFVGGAVAARDVTFEFTCNLSSP